ncbi:MAG: hypothetical protein MUQ56_02765 [Thermoleophilia bacterium]|nr:hypothetical protein [Thermoleophilia bacterium]
MGLLVACLSASGEPVAAVLQAIGEEQGRALRAQLGYGRDPVVVARVVALANRLYDIRARVATTSPEEARVITPGCPWSRNDWWGSQPCGCFSRYEVGLAGGLEPKVILRYERKLTRGDDRCVGLYAWREGRNQAASEAPASANARRPPQGC